jgi:hypothetical protein
VPDAGEGAQVAAVAEIQQDEGERLVQEAAHTPAEAEAELAEELGSQSWQRLVAPIVVLNDPIAPYTRQNNIHLFIRWCVEFLPAAVHLLLEPLEN